MHTQDRELTMHIGHDEIVIRQRYQMLSITNDVLIGLWFLIGSFMFFSDELMFAGTCLFVLGSIEMLIRPVIAATTIIGAPTALSAWERA